MTRQSRTLNHGSVLMKICMSIVSHSQPKLVEALLSSVDNYVLCERHEVLVAITENTRVSSEYNCLYPLDYTLNLQRKGFGANHNAAFERSDPDYFLIVNPDIIFTEEFNLDELVDVMQELNVDITSPVVTDQRGEIVDYKRADLTPINIIKRKLLKYSEQCCDWYAGMFLVVNGKTYRSLGGFDPRFFMYVEDCDLCIRAAEKGYKLADVVTTPVQHDARRASSKFLSLHFYWHLSSLFKYWLKRTIFLAVKK